MKMNDAPLADVSAMFPGKVRRRYLDIELPVAKITVRIRSLLAGEVSRFHASLLSKRNRKIIQSRLEDSTARLIVLCAVDANGTVLLNESHVLQIIEEWDNADVACLSDACTKHCGMDPDEFEDLAKNSGEISFASERSASPDSIAG
ncbi:hypothetical protein LCGC14_0336430 [marine sediment metagenome]|uniref:Uncharacterized protein n=1 Tax=marine sediment metagenome TaxID=412755 RepID=A0A0F9WMH2_9ZZZZ